jgi:hypothetical protein
MQKVNQLEKRSPAYLGLKNNVGTRLMKLKLGPWKPGTEDFISHRFLKEYIQDTAQKSGVDALTMYNTRVNSITKKAGVWHVGTTTWTKQGSVKSGSRQIERRAWVGAQLGNLDYGRVAELVFLGL